MNYYFIKNYYDYSDFFNIDIYYLNEYYCYIKVDFFKEDIYFDNDNNLNIYIYDLEDKKKYQIIDLKNHKNNKFIFIETSIKLYINYNNIIKIPKIIYSRNDILIKNNYKLLNNDNIDFHIAIYKINDFKIKIILRRLDNESGWNNNLILNIYDENTSDSKNNKKQIINIGSSTENFKILLKDTIIQIYEKSFDKENEKISKIIIQTGQNNCFKNILHFNSVMSFVELNPEYTYIYYSDIDGRKFLREFYSNDVNYAYDILVPGAFKADLLRYCLLYHYGGCYFDCKQILRRPINTFLNNDKTLVLCNDVIENALLNAVIFSQKKNNILEKTIKDCVYNIINKLGKSPLDVTGPLFFYKSIKKYINKDNLLLQNNRPINNFSDFTNDYINNNITLIETSEVILNRFFKGYYDNYLNINHYGKLFYNNEIYYKNIQIINNTKICIYPNKFNDKFTFNIKSINTDDSDKSKKIYNIIVKRIDSNSGWYFPLKILLINEEYQDILYEVGSSDKNKKNIFIQL